MLLQTMIKLAFQASGVLSAQKKEQETDMEKQDVGTKDADDTNDRLKVKWFSEIPHCSVSRFFLTLVGRGRHSRMNTDVSMV